MNDTLQELLDRFVGYNRLSIFNEKENIEDTFTEDEIPNEWLEEYVKDFGFNFGTLWITI